MSQDHDKALLRAFLRWWEPEAWPEPAIVERIAAFLAARAPACIQPGCNDVASTSHGNCKKHWGEDPPAPPPSPLAVALRSVADLCSALPLDTLPADVRRDINALHGAIRDVEIGLRLDEVAPSLDRCLSCSVGVLDARLGGMCGDYPGDCPAPEGERFWRVYEDAGHKWFWDPVYADGRDAKPVASPTRATKAEAEADGRASGLKEWKP